MSREHSSLTSFERRLLSATQSNTLSLRQQQRMFRFLSFDCLPGHKDTIDTIVVLGTNRLMGDFGRRIDAAAKYATTYPQAQLIVSGKGSGFSIPIFHNRTESRFMSQELQKRGVRRDRVREESRATNTKENVENSLAMVTPGDHKVLFVGSGYMGRRIYYYGKKALQKQHREDIKYFIYDTDVAGDKKRKRGVSLTPGEQIRRNFFLKYEWSRLPIYRRKGDL